ncbi:MAG: hypothetical protein M1835_005867 [Candelina submexicana]|nr:MAG: hypothetical protein M1835_005867 [Candelina submexicana]
MGRSMETSSTAPMLATEKSSKRDSQFSTTTFAPSLAPTYSSNTSTLTANTTDPRMAEIKELTAGFDRLTSPRLQQQRYVPTQEQTEHLSKLALGAKLERALGRRMSSQDAVFTDKSRRSPKVPAVIGEKPAHLRAHSGPPEL